MTITRRWDYSSNGPIIAGAERVEAPRVLVVTLTSRLAMSEHIDRIITSCASSKFALRTLRSHGLQPIHLVTRMTTVASLLYASPAWWALTDAAGRIRLERLLAGLRREGYLPEDFPSFVELARSSYAASSSQLAPIQTMFYDTI